MAGLLSDRSTSLKKIMQMSLCDGPVSSIGWSSQGFWLSDD